MIATSKPKLHPAIRRAWREAWRRRPRQPSSSWSAANYWLGEFEGAEPRYDVADMPFWKEVLEAIDDFEVEKVSIMASTQIGKTLTMLAALASLSYQAPAPMMLCSSERDVTIELRDRIYANHLASPRLRGYVPPPRLWNQRYVQLPNSRCYLAWSGSMSRTRSRPCQRVFLTEIDVYATNRTNPIRSIEERTKAFRNRKIFKESTPVGPDSAIDTEYKLGDQRVWMCRCPKCGLHQEARFFPFKQGPHAGRGGFVGLHDDQGELKSPEAARRDARYACLDGCLLDDADKAEFVRDGVWVRKGQRVDHSGKVVGKPRRSGRHASFHLWSFHSKAITIGDIAEKYATATRDDSVPDFWQDWLGRPYMETRKVPKWQHLGRAIRRDYARCQIPDQAYFLTAGGDVQEDGIWWLIRAWGSGATSWLIDWGFIRRYEHHEARSRHGIASDVARFRDVVMGRRFPFGGSGKNPEGRDKTGVKLTAMDAGFRPADVHNLHVLLREMLEDERLRLVRGDLAVSRAERWRRSLVDKNKRTGEEYAGGGMELWGINVNTFKESQLKKYADAVIGRDTFFYVPRDIIQVGQDYLKQQCNEEPRPVKKKNGRKSQEWHVISDPIGNHLWDCEIYARAAAEMVLADLGLTWDASSWVTLAPEEPTLIDL